MLGTNTTMWDWCLVSTHPNLDAWAMTAAETTHLVARRHLDLGRFRSMMCQSV
jgi:hypothetical protein